MFFFVEAPFRISCQKDYCRYCVCAWDLRPNPYSDNKEAYSHLRTYGTFFVYSG
ncbi:predicted protein [Plenodomus lingam JN3]|uniref:Predicted protein n=1 Tax=Leptosphaeria maculans (strain JN3 / isolate v23.1.3 / race Av1-4-5-6-7-8) TaxID=985895 RepID=E4ZNV9_LEPMJ|nr:predicted protein [Plenodomus lingam JN3]CBX93328.1 predicted protein [Plenodomus lingam JN3]